MRDMRDALARGQRVQILVRDYPDSDKAFAKASALALEKEIISVGR
jgi:hypothetical protein